ncbi:thioesterase domain-containing protein [Thalassotalea sp. 1_MG-2023]|uniref:thioesterase II family protein n=1 Tax=Thalassotalea sp. 1_MG-2023 TaxID=3062680 RepID=UPI0026E3B3E7|nr:thioesterase domain-containing protein [Thalassotalea sp. 1_MG-2023]MDO6428508.1 thioesterase domain-containing protein [Thalassotalea sp. 1_MG-2023]
MNIDKHSAWLDLAVRPSSDKVLIFCFPFAGGGSQFYSKWQRLLGDEVQICPVYLPGRERRIREELRENMSDLIDEITEVIAPFTNQRYAFFGHSMGALISHLLACKLVQKGFPAPNHLFLSARGYFSAESMREKVQASGFDGYLNSILGLSSQTNRVFANEELRKIFYPIFRADVHLCADWQDNFVQPLSTPITAFYGDADQSVSIESVRAWQQNTKSYFEMKVVPGDHLFVLEQSEVICEEINRAFLSDFISLTA